MPTRALLSSVAGARTAATRHAFAPGSLLVAAALPLVFLHSRAQPAIGLGLGSTTVNADLSDLAVLAVAVGALVAGIRQGFGPLRAAPWLWAAGAALLVWIGVSVLHGAGESWYPATRNGVTAAKFAEYSALALALPLLLRRPRDLLPPAAVLAVWSLCATVFGFLQFLGLVRDWDRTPAGWRKESFLGYHDFAALSAAVLSFVLIALALGANVGARRRLAAVVTVSAVVGMVIGGPLDAILGLGLAACALLLLGRRRRTLSRRRVAAIVAIVAVAAGGVLLIRGSAIDQTFRFFGAKAKQQQTTAEVQSWPQRVLLAYIGGRIWLGHPLLGVGWEGSSEPAAFTPYLADAHRHFDQPPRAFPSDRNRWGVQNAYVQALADMGVAGLVLFVAVFAATVVVGVRVAARARPEVAWIAAAAVAWALVTAGVWNGFGLVAGIPLDALTWLAVGLAATSRALEARA